MNTSEGKFRPLLRRHAEKLLRLALKVPDPKTREGLNGLRWRSQSKLKIARKSLTPANGHRSVDFDKESLAAATRLGSRRSQSDAI
jgi:hypothetical protein